MQQFYTNTVEFYRAMLRRARYCYGKLSVRPSGRDAEVSSLWYFDHIGLNSSKIISRNTNITDLFLGEHREILAGINVGYLESNFQHTKSSNICEMRQDSTKVTIEDQ